MVDFSSIGGRKFVLSIGAAGVTSVLQFMGKLDAGGVQYTITILGTVGAYITGATVDNVKAFNSEGSSDGMG